MAANSVAVPGAFTIAPLDDEGLPQFAGDLKRKDVSVKGVDGRLKTRTEVWKGAVCVYVREYDQLLCGDPA